MIELGQRRGGNWGTSPSTVKFQWWQVSWRVPLVSIWADFIPCAPSFCTIETRKLFHALRTYHAGRQFLETTLDGRWKRLSATSPDSIRPLHITTFSLLHNKERLLCSISTRTPIWRLGHDNANATGWSNYVAINRLNPGHCIVHIELIVCEQ